MMTERFTWNDDRRATFKRLWADLSWSRVEIAEYLGVSTRNLAMERARLGLKPRPRGKGHLIRGNAIQPEPTAVIRRLPESAIPWPSKDRLMAGR